jgi:ferredoxin
MIKEPVLRIERFLASFNESDWNIIVAALLPEIHEADRNATQAWFRFYPLALFRHLQSAEDTELAAQRLLMQGDWQLANRIDGSHNFLYGHRYWAEVKHAIETRLDSFELQQNWEDSNLEEEIRQTAKAVAAGGSMDVSLVLGLTAIGFMTLAQVGVAAFKDAAGRAHLNEAQQKKTADQVVAARAKDDTQGVFGFLKTVDKQWTVTFDEADPKAKFKVMHEEEITSAAARDTSRDWQTRDERCVEGPIPVECRSAACGTCWVGVVGGADKLSPVADLERKRLKLFGYQESEESNPPIRLSCQARARGAVSIVIPSWNGVFGKKVYNNIEHIELEPATTEARKNRTIVRDAVKNKLM